MIIINDNNNKEHNHSTGNNNIRGWKRIFLPCSGCSSTHRSSNRMISVAELAFRSACTNSLFSDNASMPSPSRKPRNHLKTWWKGKRTNKFTWSHGGSWQKYLPSLIPCKGISWLVNPLQVENTFSCIKNTFVGQVPMFVT